MTQSPTQDHVKDKHSMLTVIWMGLKYPQK